MSKSVEFEIKIKGGDGGVLKNLTIEASNADEAIEAIVGSASRAGESIRRMAEGALVLDTSIRAIQKLQEVVAGLAAPYNSFETAMRAANTMAGKSGVEFDELTEKIVEMSKSVPLAREELANGLYETISNGVPEGNWLEFLEQSSKAAVGGIADLGQTVTVTSTLIKTYGMEWSKAGEIQDKIQMTAKNGKTTFAALGEALPRVSGSAANLGISMDELMAVFATTTGVTGQTAEVSTQLAAVLNSLIKPTSEAETAAAAMGISFNAASVKACGGFENFLNELDESVKAYANETGQLSETIYGKLFGSAEALRLLTSLTGEQKEKFSENISSMAESAGTIASSYDNMASTGESLNVTMQNQVNAFMDGAGAIASFIGPITNLVSQLGFTVLSISQLSSATKLVITKVAALVSASSRAAIVQKTVAAATKIWTVAQAAFNAVMSANPVAIVVLAVAGLVTAIIVAYKNCEGFRKLCNKVWGVVKSLGNAVWTHLVKRFELVSSVVKKAWEWVKKFFGITDKADTSDVSKGLDKQSKSTEKVAGANKKAAASGLKAKESVDWQKMSYEQLGKAIENQETKVKRLAGTNAKNATAEAKKLKQMQDRYAKLGKQYNLSSTSTSNKNEYDGKHLIANAKSFKELGNNITYYQNKLEKTDPAQVAEIKRLSEMIAVLNKSQDAIKKLQASYSKPTKYETLDDISQALSYQQSLLSSAPIDQIAAIKKEISNLEKLKESIEEAGHVEKPVGEIETYRELSDELTYWEGKLERVGVTEREEVQARINELKALKEKWDEALAAIKMPEDIGKLNTLKKLDDAVAYYEARMKGATAEEISGIEQTISALKRKRELLSRPVTIADMGADVERMQGMSGKWLKLELKLMGMEGIKKKVQELQRMLDDVKNPLSDEERKRVQDMLKTWKDWGTELKLSETKLTDVWGSVKGVGSGVTDVTEALKGNDNAWKKTTAVVDGAIEVYESMRKIVGVVDTVLKALGITKKAEQAATEEGAAAKVAAASAEVTAAGEVTTAEVAEAASKTMAAHASIPWVGIAIGGGMVATLLGIMASLPKFADGGIAYGPTLGIFGEYAGAANNPEVVAPLSKLKSLIEPQGGGAGGEVRFRIDGRTLVGVLAKEERFRSRTR
jgi:TP901 family phage tail tape measure protein